MNLLDLMVKVGVDDKATEKIKGISSSIKGKLGKAAKVGAAAVAATGAAAAGMATAFTGAAGDVAEYGDNIDKMSQKMGLSAEAYQEWDAVLQHSGTSIDAMSRGMQTLQKKAAGNADAFQKLGISQEQVAKMSTEELFAATIEGLQGMGEGAERTALASELLGGAAKNLGPLLNTSAEDTQKMRDRVHELGGVMSDDAVKAAARYQDSLQDMQTAISGLKRSVVSDFLPGMATVMDGLGSIFSGDSEGGSKQVSEGIEQIITQIRAVTPKVMDIVTKLAPSVLGALVELVAAIAKELPSLVMGLVPKIIELAPMILDAGMQMFMGLVDALTNTGPELIDKLADAIVEMAELLVDKAPDLLVASIKLFAAIVSALVQKAPELVGKLAALVGKLISGVVQKAPDMLSAAGQLLASLAKGIADGVTTAVGAIGKVLKGVLKAAAGFVGDMLDAGANLVGGLVEGIKDNIDNVLEAITGGLKDAVDGALKFLGIASPSKLFAWMGDMTMEGLAKGIEDTASKAEAAMRNATNNIYGQAEGSVTATGARQFGGVNIQIGEMVVRNDEDIRLIAERLNTMVMREIQAGTGGMTWTQSYTMA